MSVPSQLPFSLLFRSFFKSLFGYHFYLFRMQERDGWVVWYSHNGDQGRDDGRGWSAPRGVSCAKMLILILPDIQRWGLFLD